MKLKLDLDELAEDFFDNTRLMGIVAPVKNYQFCWQLNQLLRFDFRLNNEIEIQLYKKQRYYYFSIFQYSEPTNSLTHYLYNNQFDGEYLLPEYKHLDFLWLLKGDTVAEDSFRNLMGTVKAINGVQLVMELTNIRNKGHLIF
ncbi:MAG: IPExxxVDY family protein [Candidatus Pseudobacter hemicellulosilyticus]|uniref:IPExxxVDY family protein n=1 Tax=Candidatus Pseudobacter hemicellulosilyticus TaxID=3121375 RepID=A0AAJ6BGQ0_9BACT|nr:MAG: IPExxxVDY family protein [Pseudobacter sp.]